VEICKQNNCKKFDRATDLEERNKLWQARHNSWFAHKALFPNTKVRFSSLNEKAKQYAKQFHFLVFKTISTDICVPISKLPEILIETKRDIEQFKLKASIVGHVGDGNFHTFISLDPSNPEEKKNYEEYTKKLIGHALKLEGTCTGEHGIGLGLSFSFN
jgi:D-lactate dehydrogenase (cytochrome)